MKKTILFLFVCMASIVMKAQNLIEGKYFCQDQKITLQVNLNEKNIKAPDLDDFEECYGYFQGETNGVWVILKIKEIKDNRITVRAISDRGYDAQDMMMKIIDNDSFEFSLVNDQNMKGIKDGKYVKLPKVLVFKKL